MKRSILVAALTAFILSASLQTSEAQIFRRCPGGACPTNSRVRVVVPYQYAPAVAPCEAARQVVEPCAPIAATIEEPSVAPCDPVAPTVEPCAPVATTCESYARGEYVPTEQGNICVDGTCPIRTAVRATANTAKNAVQTVAATTRFLLAANRIRAQYGLAALRADATLDAGCESQARICQSRGALIHGGGNAEILAYNWSGFDAALVQWLDSPSHRALLLAPNFRTAGVAVVRGADGRVWCAMRFR